MKKGEEHIGSRTLTGIKDGDFLKLVHNLPAHAQDHKQVNVNCKAVFPGCFLSWSKLPKGKTHFKKTVVEAFVGHQSSHLFGWGKTKAQIYRYITALTVISAPVAGNFQKETWWFYMVLPCWTNHWNQHQVSAWRPTTAFCEVHLPLAVSVSPPPRPWEKWRATVSSTTRRHPSWGQTYSQEHESSEEEPGSVAYYECILIYTGYINIIYICVSVCVNILYTHMATRHYSSNSEKATTQSNDEEPLQRFRKRLPGLPWRNDGAKMRARMAKRKRNWPCVCVWCQQLSYIFKNAWCNLLSTLPLIIIVLLQARRNRTWIMVCLATFNSSTIKFEILAWLQGRWGFCAASMVSFQATATSRVLLAGITYPSWPAVAPWNK